MKPPSVEAGREGTASSPSVGRAAWMALFLIAAATRVLFLRRWPANFDTDEAVVALQAIEILQGRFGLFLPGQSYMGSLQSLLAAPFVGLLGASTVAVRLSPMLWLVPGWWVLRRWQLRASPVPSGSSRFALAAAWLLPPATLFLAGVKARGGYLESLVLGLAGIHLLVTATAGPRRPLALRWLLAGSLLGVGVWTHDQGLLFIPAAAIVALARLRTLRSSPPVVSPARTPSLFVAPIGLLFGLALGYLPLWLPRLVPFGLGPPGTEGTGWHPDFAALTQLRSWLDALRAFPATVITSATSAGAGIVVLFFFALGVLGTAVLGVVDWMRVTRGRRARWWEVDPGLTLTAWLAVACLGVIFFSPEYRTDPQWFRYTLPLTPLLVLASARGLGRLHPRQLVPAALGLAIVGAGTALTATSSWELAQADLRPALARNLAAQGHRSVYSGAHVAYFLRWQTRGAILAASYEPPRFPEVNARAAAAPDAWIVRLREGWQPPDRHSGTARTDIDRRLAEAFEQGLPPDPVDPAIARALAGLPSDRTLYARFEPFPLLSPRDYRRDWRGWPYRRDLGRFEAIVWDPLGPSPLPDSFVAERLQEAVAAGSFAPVAQSIGWAVYRRVR